MSERMTTRFRRLLEAPELLVLPGVHDALTAKVAQKTGAKAVTMGGFAATGGAGHLSIILDRTCRPLRTDL